MIPLPFGLFGGGGNKDQESEDEILLREVSRSEEEQEVIVTGGGPPDASSSRSRSRVVNLPLSMRLLRLAGGACCSNCNHCCQPVINEQEIDEKVVLGSFSPHLRPPPRGVSSLVVGPMTPSSDSELQQRQQPVMERILMDYKAACQFYNCTMNPGVLTTLRFSLPALRVTSPFHDEAMLALAEILLKYANGPLQYIRRLDFSKHRLRGSHGFGSHGALTLAKVLQVTEYVTEVDLSRNRIGPYGATAIFLACAHNPAVAHLNVRRCCVKERGALAFAAYVAPSAVTNLVHVDLSANHMGYHGCIAIDRALQAREKMQLSSNVGTLTVDLEGNHVFQEIMNGVTHGFGVLLAFAGSWIMSAAVEGRSKRHLFSCAIYSTSLVVLYTSSTLFHSFFTMRGTKWIFEVLDKCAIYILIAGSYTPFLQIVLAHEPLYSIHLLAFLWILCCLGIGVELCLPAWQHKGKFSLAMYLGMGWSALVCLPEVARILPKEAIHLMVEGGVAYTAGVPFFVRDNNHDHAIWHLFVLAGSIFHWCGVYYFVVPREVSHVAPYPDGI